MILFTWLLLITPIQTEELFEIFLSAFLPQGRSTAEQLSDYFNKKISPRFQNGNPIYVAFDNDKMIGFAIFEKWEGQDYYLAEMAVLPAYQRRGIGKQLVFSIFEKDQNAKKILLITEKGNTWSQSFYEKIGFKPSSFHHPDYPENFIGYELSR